MREKKKSRKITGMQTYITNLTKKSVIIFRIRMASGVNATQHSHV